MPTCEICGEFKDGESFHKVKDFFRLCPKQKQWCRDCQKLYIDMKMKEHIDKLKNPTASFTVSFE
jgi:hypothetical protein